MRRALLLACLTLLALPAASSAAPTADSLLYNPAKVTTIDLTMPQASIDALLATPDEYVTATVTATDGTETVGPLQTGVKLKGHGTFQPITGKAAFKLKLNEFVSGQKLLGQKKLTLNNLTQDKSWTHETLAYEAFRAAGVQAPRTGFAYVRLNGEGLGVYLNLEPWDDVSLKRFFTKSQHLYEGEMTDDVTPGASSLFEVDEGDEDDISDLDQLIATANAGTLDTWPQDMAAVADLDQMTRMWAVEQWIGHWDGYSVWTGSWLPNNYYLHSDPTGRFTMLPSGTDQTFVWPLPFDYGGGRMYRACMATNVCHQRFHDQLTGAGAAIDAANLGARVDQLAAVLAPYRSMASRAPVPEAEWQTALQDTRNFISGRSHTMGEWLATDVPPPPRRPTADEPRVPIIPPPTVILPSTPTPAGAVAGAKTDKRRCVVPDLKGRTLATARKRLKAANCTLGTVKRKGKGKKMRVAGSDPGKGSVGPVGKKVRLRLEARR